MNSYCSSLGHQAWPFQSLVYWRGEMNLEELLVMEQLIVVSILGLLEGGNESWRYQMSMFTKATFQSLVYWRGEMNVVPCIGSNTFSSFNPWFIGGGK